MAQGPLKIAGVQIRPGPGALGMNMIVTVAVMLVLGVVAWKLANVWALLFVAILAIAGGGYVVRRSLQFAEKFPHLALLDSGDLRAYLTREIVSKGEIEPPSTPVIENPSYKEIPQRDRDAS